MGYIDAHCHVWTSDTAHYPLGPGWKQSDMKPATFTPQDLFKLTKPAGVDRVNLIQMSYYHDKDLSSNIVHTFDNRYMLNMIAMYPDVFVGTAVVDVLGEAPEKQMVELAKKGVRAFRIHPRLSKETPAQWLRPKGYEAMFATAAKHRLALSCLIDPEGLPEVDRMARKHPETTVIIDHLARIGLDGTIRDGDVKALCDLAAHKKVLVKLGAFYALGKKTPPYSDLTPLIQKVVKAFGPERCMWESDCPFQVAQHKYTDSLDLVKTRCDFLSDDDKAWLLGKTAECVLFAK